MEDSWKCIQTDSLRLEAGQTQGSFFEPRRGSDNVLGRVEEDIVQMIAANQEYLELLLKEAGFLHVTKCFPNLPRWVLDPNRRDVDLDLVIALHKNPPEIGLLEFKRIKINAVDNVEDRLSKRNGVFKLAHQLRERQNLGFRILYGVVVVQSSLGARESANTIIKGYSDKASDELWETLLESLRLYPKEAGLVLIRLDHPTSELKRTNFCVLLVRRAIPVDQSDRLSSLYIDFINSTSAGNSA